METVKQFNHASSQAHWRVERHWVSVFLLSILGFAMISTLYLMVTSQAAIIGREIQELREEIIITEHKNATLQSTLAYLTSKDKIDNRAYGLFFRPIEPEDVEYLYVPGYVIPNGAILASGQGLQPNHPDTLPEYTQSLLDWFGEQLQAQVRGLR